MVNIARPKYPAPQTATGIAETLHQVLAQNQELMQLLSVNIGKSGRKNTNSPPTPSNGPLQGQHFQPMPAYFDRYCWKHGRVSHKRANINSKAPDHKDMVTTEKNVNGSNYGLME